MAYLNVADYRLAAKRRLPRGLFEYVDRGTEDETGLVAIRRSFDDLRLMPHVLRNVSRCDLSVELLGETLPSPLVIAPTAAAGLLWYDGDVELARAATDCGVPFCVATQSITSMEDIAGRTRNANLWFQLYLWRDPDLVRSLLARVSALGIKTLILTVDTPMSPKREYNTRNGFAIPIVPSLTGGLDVATHPRWAWRVLLRYLREGGMPTYANYPAEYRTPITRDAIAEKVKLSDRLDWHEVAELRRQWFGKLLIKGVLHVDDARAAADHGLDGIVVSAHGGRNLDSAVPPAEVLPEIADAVGHKLTVLADSGVRRGSDIVKLLALGARAVLIGRSALYGTAVSGREGAAHVLRILHEEITQCLAFTGRASVGNLGRDLIFRGAGSNPAERE